MKNKEINKDYSFCNILVIAGISVLDLNCNVKCSALQRKYPMEVKTQCYRSGLSINNIEQHFFIFTLVLTVIEQIK